METKEQFLDESLDFACKSRVGFPELEYEWGFDFTHTPRRYGLGLEFHVNGSFLIGFRLGSLLVSWGQQLKHVDTRTATLPKSDDFGVYNHQEAQWVHKETQ